MKRQLTVFICALMILALVFGRAFAEVEITKTETNLVGGKIITWTATIDSVENDTSANFNLARWDHVSWVSLPFSYQVTTSTPGDSINVTTFIEGSFDGSTNWAAVDTIDAIVTEATSTGTLDLNNVKRPWYRIRMVDLAKLEEDTSATVVLIWWLNQE